MRPWRRNVRTALVVIAGLILGCAPSPGPDRDGVVTIKFWAMGREGELVTQLLPEFQRAHPLIRVQVQELPWTAAHEKLLTAFAGEVMPDVFQLGNTWVPEFRALGALAPLDQRVAASTVVDPADYFGGIWDTNVVDGKLYGIPWYVDTRVLFYRGDLLAGAGYAQPPTTWAQWMQAMGAMKKIVGPQRYVILLPLDEFEPLLALALQQDDSLLRDGGRYGNFRSPGFRRSLQLYADMFGQQLAPLHVVSNVYHEFSRGYVSFYISGPWNIGEFTRRLPAAQQSAWMTAPLPGPSGPAASIAGGSSLVVSSRSKHQSAAWELIEYLSSPESADRFNQLSGDLPPRRSSWQRPRLAGDIHARAFREQLERVRAAPKVPEWEHIASAMRVVAEGVAHGQLTVDQAVRELDDQADHILEKRRWLLDREQHR